MPLNFTVLSNETPFNRDTVETCIHEVVQAMSRMLAAKGSVQLDFCNIGRLFIRENKVKMRFFREFITQLDSSGEMESAFRPGTAQTELSIMSDPSFSRPGTQALVLPRIVEPSGSGNSLSLDLSPLLVAEPVDVGLNKSDDINKEDTVRRKSPLVIETKSSEVLLNPLAASPESGKQSPVVPHKSSSESRCLVPKPAALFVGDDYTTAPGHMQTHLANVARFTAAPGSAKKNDKATLPEPEQAKISNSTPSKISPPLASLVWCEESPLVSIYRIADVVTPSHMFTLNLSWPGALLPVSPTSPEEHSCRHNQG